VSKPRKPSPAQLAALRNMAAGKRPGYGIYGNSAHGGLSGTIVSLHRRGWIDTNGITEAGRTALRQKEGK
jgi:hypothetical protein